jgi:hypothetical protein
MSQEYKERLRREKEAAIAAEAARREEKISRVRITHNGTSQQTPSPTPTSVSPAAKAAEDPIPPLNLEDGKMRIYVTLNDDRGVDRVDWDPRLTAYSAMLALIESQAVVVPSLNKFLNDAIESKVQEARAEVNTNG